jgi:prepilin-type N-terminal cleavage/methylation domain-containing protein
LVRRQAFTLVELLVVIAIIAILVALTGAGIFYWIGSQQRRNTEGSIRTINTVFNKQWAYVIEEAKKETPSSAVQQWAAPDPTGERARILWIKLRLVEAFPMAFAEINGNAAGAGNTDPIYYLVNNYIPSTQRKYLDTYQRTLGSTRYSDAGTPLHSTESAACLLMALGVARGGASLTPDQLGSAGTGDTDQDGIKEIIDGWRKPLAFYRFAWSTTGAPLNIQGLNPAAANSRNEKFADPLDPNGVLLTWPAVAPAKGTPPSPWDPKVFPSTRAMYEALLHPIANNKGAAYANYVIPIIVGNGPDQQLGLTLPSPATLSAGAGLNPTPAANDNIFSFNLKGAN